MWNFLEIFESTKVIKIYLHGSGRMSQDNYVWNQVQFI